MSAGGITFALVVAAELIALFRLMLPRFVAYCEARHDAFYNRADGDCFQASLLNHAHPTTFAGAEHHDL